MSAEQRTEWANRWPSGEVGDVRIHPEIAEGMAAKHRKDGFETTPVKRTVTTTFGDWEDV